MSSQQSNHLHSFDGSPAMELVCMYSETRAKGGDVAVHTRVWHGGYAVTQYTVGLILRERRVNGEVQRRELFARHGMTADALVREGISMADEWLAMETM